MSRSWVALGTRGSALAMVQARLVQEAFERDGQRVRIVVVETAGDRRAADTAWGEGAFVAAIERALLDGRVDVAVHSAKDVPTDEHPRLRIGAYLRRADPRDALVVKPDAGTRRLADLPSGTRVGTDSPRRTGFLRALRPDLVVHPLHGNVDTRLRRLDEGDTDALLLACAGLDRLGLGERITERIAADVIPPAPGQGAVAVQIRRNDARMLTLAASIDDRATRTAVEAERAFLHASGGGCRSPIGALATVSAGRLDIVAGRAAIDGSATAFARRSGPIADADRLARELAGEIGRADAGFVALRPGTVAPRVLVTRAVDQSTELATALREAGLAPCPIPAIAVERHPERGPLDRAAGTLGDYRWVVVTSANGARAIVDAAGRDRIETLSPAGGPASSASAPRARGPAWAAIGPQTCAVLEREGIEVGFRPSRSNVAALADELPVDAGDRVAVIRGDLADGRLASSLRERGADVDDVIAYRTIEGPATSRRLLVEALAAGPVAAVVFTSGSTVRGLVAIAAAEALDVRSIPAGCIGPETAREAARAGFRIIATSPTPDPTALAATIAAALDRQTQEIA